jgi:hypothetical protein
MIFHDHGFNRLIPGAPRSVLRALPAGMAGVHAPNRQRYLELFAKSLAMVLKVISRSLQSMMNVQCMNLVWPFLRARQQQGGGVCAATESYGER